MFDSIQFLEHGAWLSSPVAPIRSTAGTGHKHAAVGMSRSTRAGFFCQAWATDFGKPKQLTRTLDKKCRLFARYAHRIFELPPAPEFEWRFIGFDPLRLMEVIEDLRSNIPAQRNAPDPVRRLKHFLDRLA